MIGSTISHYRILDKIGRGGMGVVFKAEDIRLGRIVALKFLPDELVNNSQAAERFRREPRAASALNHPNICTIFDIGDEDGRAFIAMEYLEGTSLQSFLDDTHTPLPLEKILSISLDAINGLEAAHARGIIHRDIKPANIFVTSQGAAKILDFGLAKFTATQASTDDATKMEGPISTSGEALGTAAYMSPEQALGLSLDARADLFSFGIVLYEMATGWRPFRGDTTGILLMSIVQEIPPGPMKLNPAVPAELEHIINKALEKNANLRYQTAAEMRSDLQRLQRDSRTGASAISTLPIPVAASSAQPSAVAAGPAPVRSTEPVAKPVAGVAKSRRRPLWFTSAATLLITMGIGVWLFTGHRAHALGERDTVLLADFANSTGDAVFDDTLKQALAVDLSQSPFLNIVSDANVRNTLQQMTRSPNERLTDEIAREVCQRSASKAFISGSISSLGSDYVIGLNAINCSSGDSLAREQVQASSKEKVIDALGHATARLRSELGESLPSVQKFDVPLADATTSSLDALKAYSMGNKALITEGETAAIPLFERAIELDPNFALAYASLGTAYANLRESDLAKQNYKKAYDLRGRVSAREDYAISAYYYNDVTGDLGKSDQTYELYAQAYPRNWVPHNNLGGNYAALGEWNKALAEGLEASRLNPDSGITYGSVIEFYCRLDRFKEAKETYQHAVQRGLDYPDLHYYRYGVAFLEGDSAEMQRQVEWAAGKAGREDVLLSYQSDTEAFAGHLNQSRELSRRAIDSARLAGEKETAAKRELNEALREVEFGNVVAARSEAEAALKLGSTPSTRVLAALVFARTHDSERAQKIADELEEQNPQNTKLNVYWLPTVRSAIALSRNDPTHAIEILQTATAYELGAAGPQPELGEMCYPVYLRGQAYLTLHQGTKAASEFRKFLDHKGVVINSPLAALARLGLARAYVLEDDTTHARSGYQDFLTLWKDADPDIPILVAAKSESAKIK